MTVFLARVPPLQLATIMGGPFQRKTRQKKRDYKNTHVVENNGTRTRGKKKKKERKDTQNW